MQRPLYVCSGALLRRGVDLGVRRLLPRGLYLLWRAERSRGLFMRGRDCVDHHRRHILRVRLDVLHRGHVLLRWQRAAIVVYMQRRLRFNLNDIERMHVNDRDLRGVYGREFVRRWCRAAFHLLLYARLLLCGGRGYELCGYGGILRDLPRRKFLCRGCRLPRRMQLQFRIFFVCWCCHYVRWNGCKLHSLRCRKFLCGCRRRASGMRMQQRLCVNIDNDDRLHGQHRHLRCLWCRLPLRW